VLALLATAEAYSRLHAAHVLGPVAHRALGSIVTTAGAAGLLFGLGGYAPARWLVTGRLREHRFLLMLPIGATVAPLELTVLGQLHVPFGISLPIVLAVGAALAVASHLVPRRLPIEDTPPPSATWGPRILLPFYLAALVAAISLLPAFRDGFAGIPGSNGDAILVVGSAQLLEHAPPGATRFDQPINSVPLTWRSKYPIYYALAATAKIAGQDPITAFAALSAFLYGLAALGFFLFVYVVLQGRLLAALLATFLVPLDRILVYVAIHPFYNELWAAFLLSFMLVTGWVFLERPSRRALTLFLLFSALGLFAYPLVFPFPVMFLGTKAWLQRRQRHRNGTPWAGWLGMLGIPRPRQRPRAWALTGLLVLPFIPLLVRGASEKFFSALAVLPPWSDLGGWSAPGVPYIPFGRFLGLERGTIEEVICLGLVLIGLLLGLRTARRSLHWPLIALIGGGLAIGGYFWLRGQGQLFYFKDLAFTGPFILCVALVGTFRQGLNRRATVVRTVALLVVVAAFMSDADTEIDTTFQQADASMVGIRGWERLMAPGSSVRIDIPPSGVQLLGAYMLVHHPVSTLHPLYGFLPHLPVGRRADYILSGHTLRPPADALPRPVAINAKFVLYRMRPDVPGPDLSSRRLVLSITKVTIP
jgi:hypothetical protein